MSEGRSCQGIHSFLTHLALGEVLFLCLELLTLVRVDPYRRVHLMHWLFSIRINIFSTQFRLFARLVELPSEGLPPVVEIPPNFAAAWHSIRAVPRVNHIAHLGGISSLDW